MNLHSLLRKRAEDRNPVRVGVIGAGKFSSMFLSQAARTPGMHVVGIAELDPAELELNLGRSHTLARRPELYGELAAGGSTGTKQQRDEIRKKLGVDVDERNPVEG